jgi:NAD(P)-dependent dehydrogenase (short-subunit alcohol dehydrogenase family)
VIGVRADTGDDGSVAAMAEEVVRQLAGVDILVNAAAIPNTGGFSEDALQDEINVKVQGYLRTARAFAPLMTGQGWGRIINIGGTAARQTGSVVGSVRNVAVAALTKNLADELGPQGVNVVVVHPGLTRTEQTAQLLAAAARARGTSVEEAQRAMESAVSIGRLVTAEERRHPRRHPLLRQMPSRYRVSVARNTPGRSRSGLRPGCPVRSGRRSRDRH